MWKAQTINWPVWILYSIDGEIYTWEEVIEKYSAELKDILDKQDIYESPTEHPDQLTLDLDFNY